jgi:hypothetical protein
VEAVSNNSRTAAMARIEPGRILLAGSWPVFDLLRT